MRALVYFVAATVDGFITDPGGADPSDSEVFGPVASDYLELLVAQYPETLPDQARRALSIGATGSRFDTVLEGRRSYQTGLAVGVTDAYPHLRHVVFSRTLTESPDPGVELVGTDPIATARDLKQQPGKDIWLVGGGELAGTLYSEIDRLIIKLNPTTIGTGTPMFGRSATFEPRHWLLADHLVLASGTLFLTYNRTAP